MKRCNFLGLVVLFTILVTTYGSVLPPKCPDGEVPKCPDPDGEYSTFFPHPKDCHWFFHCSNGVAYCKVCPADLHWNVELETCDYPYRAGCNEADTPTTTTPPPTNTTEEPTKPPVLCPDGEVPKCPFPDGEYSTFFPHPNDCSWFFHCSNGEAYCKVCPPGLHWNVELETCDYPCDAGCISKPTTTTTTTTTTAPSTTTTTEEPTTPLVDKCPDGEVPKCPFPDGEYSTFFPHPNDCHWFFHCSNGVAYCKVCPADLHWNVELETCDYDYRAGCN